jgi:septal ring factor EnvC (AmiA/AmiB activator)
MQKWRVEELKQRESKLKSKHMAQANHLKGDISRLEKRLVTERERLENESKRKVAAAEWNTRNHGCNPDE